MYTRRIRSGKYGLYNGKLYRILSESGSSDPEMLTLCSEDEDDLKNGFTNKYSELSTKTIGFTCTKDVPKSEIAQVYNITPNAVVYRGFGVGVIGQRSGTNLVTLCSKWIRSCNPGEKEREYEQELIKRGFHRGIVDKTCYIYIKEVALDDSELVLYELRQKTDLDKP